MKKNIFSVVRRIMSSGLMLVFLFQYVSAPTKDFRIRMNEFKHGMMVARKMMHEFEFDRFIKDLGYRESANNWKCVNFIGCFGEWQFAESTLHYLGFKQVTLKKFRSDPDIFPPHLQRKALESLIKVNLFLMKECDRFIGDTIKGIPITKPGMIAAAHLGGARSVRLYLSSGGKIDKADALGTRVSDYMLKFAFYDFE